MEDILSSIKRIIAEDSEATLSAPRPKRSVALTPLAVPSVEQPDDDDEGVLELTDPVALETSPTAPAPKTEAKAEAPKPAEPAPKADAVPPAKKPDLVSPTTVEASRSSLAALSAMIVKPEVTGTDTLEGMVREMLRPMLAEWLDAKLPEIVERIVAQEIARITARG